MREPGVVLLDHGTRWWSPTFDGVEEAPDGVLRLAAVPGSGRALVDLAGTFGGLTNPTGIAVDGAGRIYVADAGADVVKRFDVCRGSFEPLPCFGGTGSAPRELRAPRGIAVSRAGVLAVADTGNARVQLVALDALALLDVLPAPAGGWEPWDVAFDDCGRLFVTDRAGGLVHRFDARRRPLAPLIGVARPTHLAIDSDGRLYVADETAGDVAVFETDGTLTTRVAAAEWLPDRFRPVVVAIDVHGNLLVADRVGCLWKACRPGRRGTRVTFTRVPGALGDTVAALAFDPNGNAVVAHGGYVVELASDGAFTRQGRMTSSVLDSVIAGCVWHRVEIDAEVPDGCTIEVRTYTADVELDRSEIERLADDAWSTNCTWSGRTGGPGAWDCLVLGPLGRYLWLQLVLRGTGTTTPHVRAVRVSFARQSSLEYLPGVYAEGPGGQFLDRFCSIFDREQARIDTILDDLPAYVDPRSAPAQPIDGGTDFLSWLGSWVGVTFEGAWSEARRREIVARAVTLYGRRGTLDGVRDAVRVVAGLPANARGLPLPGVLEDFKLRRWFFAGGSTLGDHTTLWGARIVDRLQIGESSRIGELRLTELPDPQRDPFHHFAHRFTVFVPAACVPDESARRAVERIVEASKPAHTQFRLELVQPRLRVGVQSTVGVDMVVGRPPRAAHAGSAHVGFDSVLRRDPAEPAAGGFRVGERGVVGGAVL
jgi:phage tail-like protein